MSKTLIASLCALLIVAVAVFLLYTPASSETYYARSRNLLRVAKTYHRAGCTELSGNDLVVFSSACEAATAGYLRCGKCNPRGCE